MSYFIGFADRWDVLVVGTIPKGYDFQSLFSVYSVYCFMYLNDGQRDRRSVFEISYANLIGGCCFRLPAPVLPKFNYFTELLPDIFVLGIVTFAINASLVKTYASELGYDVLDNQVFSK